MSDFTDVSDNLSLPYIQPSQAQKHVTHNEGMRRLDALVQLAVVSADIAQPPATPQSGTRYIVPVDDSSGWAGQEGMLAVFEENAWRYLSPQQGWTAWVADIASHLVYDGARWQPSASTPELQNIDYLGVQTVADDTNRLAVSSAATLLTHARAGHQLKINKAEASDTASLLFQTGWSGRAEMGTAGTDDFEIKVSADGSTFHTALQADAASGQVHFPQGATGLAPAAFGNGALLTVDYASARGLDLVTNGTGMLGNTYNYPAQFSYDPVFTPNLPASFSLAGYYPGAVAMSEFLAVDPNQVWCVSSCLRQEGLPGDWSAHPFGERHSQYMGLQCFDLDRQAIDASHHMRYKQDGFDSLTTLAAPLAPGDMVVELTDSSGWNNTVGQSYNRGIILFGYRNSSGGVYEDYSRLPAFGLFATAGVNKSAHTITLSAPLPASLANPGDPSGIWPAGTRIANTTSGGQYKYVNYSGVHVPQTNKWYRGTGYIGGIDRSGTNAEFNFPPGTAYVKPFWLPNYSNQPGGTAGHADTGPAHRVWFAGVSVVPETLARMSPVTSGNTAGSHAIKVPVVDFASGTLSLQPATRTLEPL